MVIGSRSSKVTLYDSGNNDRCREKEFSSILYCDVKELNYGQINHFLEIWNISSNSSLGKLLRNNFMLSLYCEMTQQDSTKPDENITAAQLINDYFEKCFKRKFIKNNIDEFRNKTNREFDEEYGKFLQNKLDFRSSSKIKRLVDDYEKISSLIEEQSFTKEFIKITAADIDFDVLDFSQIITDADYGCEELDGLHVFRYMFKHEIYQEYFQSRNLANKLDYYKDYSRRDFISLQNLISNCVTDPDTYKQNIIVCEQLYELYSNLGSLGSKKSLFVCQLVGEMLKVKPVLVVGLYNLVVSIEKLTEKIKAGEIKVLSRFAYTCWIENSFRDLLESTKPSINLLLIGHFTGNDREIFTEIKNVPTEIINTGIAEIMFPKTQNEHYYSVDNCIIERKTKTVVLGCLKSKIPKDGSVSRICRHSFSYLYCDCSADEFVSMACRSRVMVLNERQEYVYKYDSEFDYKSLVQVETGREKGLVFEDRKGLQKFLGDDVISLCIPNSIEFIDTFAFVASIFSIMFLGTRSQWEDLTEQVFLEKGSTVFCLDGAIEYVNVYAEPEEY